MGNCQAIDAATLVVQHPSGKADKFYWPLSASEVMKMNPGHYVALLLSTTLINHPSNNNNNGGASECSSNTSTSNNNNNNDNGSVRLTRIKLLRPTDTLVLGHVYRLITTQEVMQSLLAKKQAKMKKNLPELAEIKAKDRHQLAPETRRSGHHKDHQVQKNERSRPRTKTSTNPSASTARSRTWQPSLQSISEASAAAAAAANGS